MLGPRQRLRLRQDFPSVSRARNLALAALIATAAAGCAPDRSPPRIIRVWCQQGQEAENQAMRAMAAAFNEAHAAQNLEAQLTFFPDFQYTEKVSIAAAARDLPDVLALDGPTVAQFVDAGLLRPIAAWFSAAELADFAPTIRAQGTIGGELYALGAFDSAMVLYYDRELLARAGVMAPADSRGWTWDEFLVACAQLKAAGLDPVALHMDITGDEWYTYAFSPLLWSAGGHLIDAEGRQVEGVLNAPENAAALRRWREVFARDFAARAPIDPDPFGHGQTALDWSGHWMVRSHLEAKGDRLGAMPLPRMGPETVAACGSWCWGLTQDARDPDAAALWLRWVTDPVHGIQPIVAANGAVPARASAYPLFPEYADPPFRLFRDLQETAGRPRPRTPVYPTLTQHVAAALRDVARGADPQECLDRAAAQVQRRLDRQGGTP
ncbi:MAG: sugar ABC transporter substrate-binding protein [Kiritimatiellia bacterium]